MATRGQTETFGIAVASARKAAALSQKQLADAIKKDDGTPISPQYLNDLEHDRRNPPAEPMLRQIAERLHVPADYLTFLAGQLPRELRDGAATPEQVERAFSAFRRELRK